MLRVGVYYAPPPEDMLWEAGCAWLGRDPQTASPVRQPAIPDIATLTEEPRRYGFHATLKPPMRLCVDWNELRDGARALAETIAPFDLPPLSVQYVHGFLALRETVASAELQSLADRCVINLDRFRAPAGPNELARRRNERLSAVQGELLERWGYPYVLGEWFFHMTLSRRLAADERARLMPAANAWFADALRISRRVNAVCLFVQTAADAPFTIAERFPLLG